MLGTIQNPRATDEDAKLVLFSCPDWLDIDGVEPAVPPDVMGAHAICVEGSGLCRHHGMRIVPSDAIESSWRFADG